MSIKIILFGCLVILLVYTNSIFFKFGLHIFMQYLKRTCRHDLVSRFKWVEVALLDPTGKELVRRHMLSGWFGSAFEVAGVASFIFDCFDKETRLGASFLHFKLGSYCGHCDNWLGSTVEQRWEMSDIYLRAAYPSVSFGKAVEKLVKKFLLDLNAHR
jgi:hypothetical protein